MKILSIDWDYFYPDSIDYDWGANEERDIYLNFLWKMRVSNVNLITQVPALKEYVPKIPKDFWTGTVSNKPSLLVTDSHADIDEIIKDNSIVVNLDAHHDYGYDMKDKLDCGNWAQIAKEEGRIKEYHLVYPGWRLDKPEDEEHTVQHLILQTRITSISYKLPAKQDYDIIFICRSGCWTPPWHDNKFFKFAKSSPHNSDIQYDVLPREFDMKQALQLGKEMQKKFEELMVK